MPVMLDCKKVPEVSYWAQPKRGTWSKITETRFREQAKKPLLIPDDVYLPWLERWKVVRKQDTPNFSLGLATIIFASALLKPKELSLVGFDNLLDPNLLWYDRADKGPRWPTRHEWHVESSMLDMIEDEYKVEINGFR